GTAEVDVVARLGAEPAAVVQELVAGLDGWMLERRRNRPEAEWRRLYRVAERVGGSELRRPVRGRPGGGGAGAAGRVGRRGGRRGSGQTGGPGTRCWN